MSSKAAAHRRLAGRLVIATHNPGKLKEMRELLMPYGIDAALGRRARLARARGERHDLQGERAHQGARGGNGVRFAGVRGRFRPDRRCARWRARHLLGALGGARQGLPARHADGGRQVARARRARARPAQGAFRLRALPRLARRTRRRIRGRGRRHPRLAAARRQGFRLRSDVLARRPRAAPSAR